MIKAAASAHGEEVPPDPAALIQSMRALGYSLPTAIADLIDNSISAGATEVEVSFDWAGPQSSISVADDGVGMDKGELRQAMRVGSKNPSDERAADDLGRFGLGLKSAGWSQARSLSVITKAAGGATVARRWDLDHVTREQKWLLLETLTGFGEAVWDRVDQKSHGTVVLLEDADRLVGPAPAADEAAHIRFLELARATEAHLGKVFHRFLSGPRAIEIKLNGAAVEPWDPFLENHPATQRMETEVFTVDTDVGKARVEVTPFVLPHVSKLNSKEHKGAGGDAGWNSQQGFYVYRGRRLIVDGGWLGLKGMKQEEHLKLARVRIDLDNRQDELWQLDVRKASASIPGVLRDELRRIAEVARRSAREAYAFRGKTIARDSKRDSTLNFVWQTKAIRGGGRKFTINRSHPVVSVAINADEPARAGAVEAVVRLAEENIPVDAIILEAREAPDRRRADPYEGKSSEVKDLLERTIEKMEGPGVSRTACLKALAVAEPFIFHPEIVAAVKEEIDAEK